MVLGLFFGGAHKLVAVIAALILAFPPVLNKFGRTEGLLMSLSLVLFYTFRGIIVIATSDNGGERKRIVTTNQFFQFAEIPLMFGIIWLGLNFLPEWLAIPYEKLLLWSTPIFVLLEGLSAVVIILECGERCSLALENATFLPKILLIMISAGLCAVSIAIILDIYAAGLLGVASASFVASIVTLMIVLTIGTMAVDHASIGDASLMFLYITYNIWCITRRAQPQTLGYLQRMYSLFSFKSTTPSILSTLNSMLAMFSMEIVVHLVFQMCVFVVAVRLITKAFSENTAKETEDWQNWIFNYLWPTFGKLILVLVYTYAWLHRMIALERDENEYEGFFRLIIGIFFLISIGSWWTKPNTWRYVNMVACVLIYAKHLITSPEDAIFS
jgi:hypothetical protein